MHSSCDICTGELLNQTAPTDLTNSCPPSPVPMGNMSPTLQAQLLALCLYKNTTFSPQTQKLQQHLPGLRRERMSNFCDRSRVHKHRRLLLLTTRACSVPFAVHFAPCPVPGCSWNVACEPRPHHNQGDHCPPLKVQRMQRSGARPKGGSEPFTWWNCKKTGTVLVVLALKQSCLAQGVIEYAGGSGWNQEGQWAARIWDWTTNSPSQKQLQIP